MIWLLFGQYWEKLGNFFIPSSGHTGAKAKSRDFKTAKRSYTKRSNVNPDNFEDGSVLDLQLIGTESLLILGRGNSCESFLPLFQETDFRQ